MTSKKLMSLATTLSVRGMITVACFVTLGSGLTGVMLERSAKSRAQETGGIVAEQVTAEIRTQFERPIGIAGGLRSAITAARAQGVTGRDAHNGILRTTLMGNPVLIGTWMGWEPNAFDGRDAAHANTQGNDATGRFLPYWHHDGDGAAMEPLRGYDKPGVGDWYLVPLRTGRPLMWGPSLYEVAGKSRLMASIVLPYQERGRTIGVLGVDLGLDNLSTNIAALHLPFDGDVEVLSENDLYVYSRDAAVIGKKGAHFTERTEVVTDPVMGKVIQIVRPIRFDGFDRGWIVRVRLPMSAVLADARRVELVLLISALAMVMGLALVLRFMSTRIVGRPLTELAGEMDQLAAGDLEDPRRRPAQASEIARMRGAIDVFRDNARAKHAADVAKARADADQKMVVDTVSEQLSGLSKGDLTATIAVEFPADYAALKVNFNDAVARLRDLIGAVSESATAIRTGSDEIAQASEDLARRTESNAASLEETAASVTQMDGRLKATATAATRTVERADQAIATVGGGRAVADEAVQAMGRVSDSAKGIDSVIEGLDKIAFQTRVLAMNAAVEAGRAGDAGRGFAVVADLVSALAMRAEEEAKRARDQLTVTQTDIVTAVEAVTKVDGALAAISGDVAKVHELLATMAADNQAQSGAITEISVAIGSMDQSTQQNAAMVEETSAAARNLAGEVTGLAEQAARFNIGRPVAAPTVRSGYAGPAAYTAPAAAARPIVPGRAMAAADEWTAF